MLNPLLFSDVGGFAGSGARAQLTRQAAGGLLQARSGARAEDGSRACQAC